MPTVLPIPGVSKSPVSAFSFAFPKSTTLPMPHALTIAHTYYWARGHPPWCDEDLFEGKKMYVSLYCSANSPARSETATLLHGGHHFTMVALVKYVAV